MILRVENWTDHFEFRLSIVPHKRPHVRKGISIKVLYKDELDDGFLDKPFDANKAYIVLQEFD